MADIFRPAGPPASLLGQKFRVQRWEPDDCPSASLYQMALETALSVLDSRLPETLRAVSFQADREYPCRDEGASGRQRHSKTDWRPGRKSYASARRSFRPAPSGTNYFES